jgi:hypothetical protein
MNHQFRGTAYGRTQQSSSSISNEGRQTVPSNVWSVPAEVRQVDGKWKAVRLDGKPRWEDTLSGSPIADEIGTSRANRR